MTMAKIPSLSTIHNLSRNIVVCVQVYYHHKSMPIGTKRKLLLSKLEIKLMWKTMSFTFIRTRFALQSCHTQVGQYSEVVHSTLEVFEWTAHVDPSSSCTMCCFLKRKVLGEGQRRWKWTVGVPLISFMTWIMHDAPIRWHLFHCNPHDFCWQHIMEDYVVDFIDIWRVGIGMLGEQGAKVLGLRRSRKHPYHIQPTNTHLCQHDKWLWTDEEGCNGAPLENMSRQGCSSTSSCNIKRKKK